MNLTHVLAFHRVAAAGSFTLAARMTGVSQPTLSAQVGALERMTGRALFVRAKRRIRLTPAGDTLYAATARLAGAVDGVAEALAMERAGSGGRLRVTADSAVHVIPILAAMKRRSPAFSFSIRIDNSVGVLAQILNDEADVGVMARPTRDARLHTAELRKDRIVLLAARNHPWSGRKRVPLAALTECELVVRERGSITREVIEARIDEAGIRPREVIEVETREAVREAVAAGLGVGVVFASEAAEDRRLERIALQGADLAVSEHMVCRSERKGLGLVGQFLDMAQRIARQHRWLG